MPPLNKNLGALAGRVIPYALIALHPSYVQHPLLDTVEHGVQVFFLGGGGRQGGQSPPLKVALPP